MELSPLGQCGYREAESACLAHSVVLLRGVIGALEFRHIGFLFTIPLAAVFLVLAAIPTLDDLRSLKP